MFAHIKIMCWAWFKARFLAAAFFLLKSQTSISFAWPQLQKKKLSTYGSLKMKKLSPPLLVQVPLWVTFSLSIIMAFLSPYSNHLPDHSSDSSQGRPKSVIATWSNICYSTSTTLLCNLVNQTHVLLLRRPSLEKLTCLLRRKQGQLLPFFAKLLMKKSKWTCKYYTLGESRSTTKGMPRRYWIAKSTFLRPPQCILGRAWP